MREQNIPVVGNGLVSHHVVERLVNADLPVRITVIGEEPRPAYDRVHLSDVFAAKGPT